MSKLKRWDKESGQYIDAGIWTGAVKKAKRRQTTKKQRQALQDWLSSLDSEEV